MIVSTVSLDDEALVEPSTFVEEIPRAAVHEAIADPTAVEPGLTHADAEVADVGPAGQGMLKFDAPDPDEAQTWLAMRQGRTPGDGDAFHGQVAPLPAPWSVSALETYLGCPFKFFAQHVLRLEEEPEDEEVMDPRTQGQFVHEVFEAFFKRWQEDGHQAITPDTIDTARTVFREVVEESLVHSPTQKRRSSALGCSDRRRPLVSAKPCFEWRPNARSRSSTGCSSTG